MLEDKLDQLAIINGYVAMYRDRIDEIKHTYFNSHGLMSHEKTVKSIEVYSRCIGFWTRKFNKIKDSLEIDK